MIRSMTGYGRSEKTIDGMAVTVEIRSVNQRGFEYSSRLPRAYGFLDEKLKKLLQEQISRGKVEISVMIDTLDMPDCVIAVNESLAKAYLDALHGLHDRYGLPDDVTVTDVARFPDVLTVRKTPENEDKIWAAVEQTASEALAHFIAMREREGAHLRADLLEKRETILSLVGKVEERSPEIVKEHMERVTARMQELLATATVDEQRLLTEAALFADKTAVDEETVRLRSHMDELKRLLDSDDAIGRRLDFLVQEINRESNTIGSKVRDVELARVVVDLKTEIEKIREQLQNIE